MGDPSETSPQAIGAGPARELPAAVNPATLASRRRFADKMDRYRNELVSRLNLPSAQATELLALMKDHDDARMGIVAELDQNPNLAEEAVTQRPEFAAADPAVSEGRISALLGEGNYRRLVQLWQTREEWLPRVAVAGEVARPPVRDQLTTAAAARQLTRAPVVAGCLHEIEGGAK